MFRVCIILVSSVLWLVSCSKHPEEDAFKQIQLHWNPVDEAAYQLDEKGALVFNGLCGDTRFSDLPECSWQTTCTDGSASVVKFHNER